MASLPRLQKDIKKTSFLGNCCVEKFSTSSVCLRMNKVHYRTLSYSEISNQGRTGFYYFQNHKKVCIFIIFIADFENSTRHPAIYIYNFNINHIFSIYWGRFYSIYVTHICYRICYICAGMSWYQYVDVIGTGINYLAANSC